MSRLRFAVFCVIVALLGVSLVSAQETVDLNAQFTEAGVVIITPDNIQWQENENVEGVSNARLVGDPAAEGHYVSLGRLSEGTIFPAHAHPDDRLTTVVSGTMYYGIGEAFDEAKLEAYPAGSVIYTPATVPHIMWSPIGETIVQETGFGPSGVIDPSEWQAPTTDSGLTTAVLDEVVWEPMAEIEGVRSTVMAGDPTAEGLYSLYGNMAQGATFPVHAHPDVRISTVIAGTMYFGIGAEFDESRLVAVPAGSVIYTPAGVPHFMATPDNNMLSQDAGFGPTGMLEEAEWVDLTAP